MNLKGYDKVIKECRELGILKNQDYSRYMDNIGMTGLNGIAVRLIDKAVRLYNLTRVDGDKPSIASEKVEDTLKDMANYSVYGVLLARNEWKLDPLQVRKRIKVNGRRKRKS